MTIVIGHWSLAYFPHIPRAFVAILCGAQVTA
jgi:hypothetical protein